MDGRAAKTREEGLTVADQAGDVAIVEASAEDLDLIVPLFDQYRMFYGEPSDLALARRFIGAQSGLT